MCGDRFVKTLHLQTHISHLHYQKALFRRDRESIQNFTILKLEVEEQIDNNKSMCAVLLKNYGGDV